MSVDGPIDPIKFEVIRNGLVAATDEMALALRRSAYSTNIKTRSDFSTAFFDSGLRSVAQGFAQPVHLGSLVESVRRAVTEYGPENLGPGDALMMNDPYRGGVHLNDIILITAIHHAGRPFGYVANLAHHVDVGGGAPASIGAFREVFQEGVIIPPVKIVEAGRIVPDIFNLVLAQIRSKHETAGDFRAQVAAGNTGVRRLTALIERHGAGLIERYMEELIAYTERRTASELARLPRGVFEAEGQVDNDGHSDRPVRIPVRIVIDEEGVFFDLSGAEPQRRAPVNSTYAMTFSACAYALKCLVDPDLPTNDGFYRQVRLDAPPGTIANCSAPAPVVGGWETQTRLVDVIFKALSPVLRDKVAAGTKAMMCHAGFGGVDPVSGDYYCYLETLGGGYGGRHASDGPDAVQAHGQNTENAPVEEAERNYPVHIVRHELIPDSDGAGEFRGGLGIRKDYLFRDRPTTFTILSDRDREGPWGLFGGEPGRRAEYFLNPDGESPRRLSSKVTLDLVPGDVVSYRTCGGGGFGHPHERLPERVLKDVIEGKVSRDRARSAYGVALAADELAVDEAETRRLRSGQTRG